MATKLELRTFQKTLPPINFNVCRGLTHRGVSTPTLANLVSLFLSHFDGAYYYIDTILPRRCIKADYSINMLKLPQVTSNSKIIVFNVH